MQPKARVFASSEKNYVIHNENLKYYLERKVKHLKVYRGIKFSTDDYLKVVVSLLLVQLIMITLFFCGVKKYIEFNRVRLAQCPGDKS